MRKLTLCLLMSIFLICQLSFTAVSAADVDFDAILEQAEQLQDTAAENFKYTAMPTRSPDHIRIDGIQDTCTDTVIKIPNEIGGLPVTEINTGAFANNAVIQQVIFPDSVTSIGYRAFDRSTGLKTVVLPANAEIKSYSGTNEYNYGAFHACTALTTVVSRAGTGDSALKIGNHAFDGCTALKNVSLPSVSSIGSYAFRNCSALTSIELPSSLTAIQNSAFAGSGLKSVAIPASAVTLGTHIFQNCKSLTTAVLANTKAANYMFDGCTALKSVSMPSVTSIGSHAFRNCSALTSITLPDSLTAIQTRAFEGSGLTSVTVPAGVNNIADHVFAGCASLTKAVLSGEKTGNYMFSDCDALTAVEMPKVTTIANYAFSGCDALTTVDFTSVTAVGESAFSGCTALSGITMDKVTSIGKSAFSGCTKLAEIGIPAVTSIGEEAFRGCVSLEQITLPGTLKTLAAGIFKECSKLSDVTLSEGITSLGETMFAGLTQIKKITLPDSLKTIGSSAFKDCTGLAEIVMPAVEEIRADAFYGCTGLTSAALPSTLTDIGNEAFRKSGLTSAVLPAGLGSLGNHAFADCGNLQTVTLPAHMKIKTLGTEMFLNCVKLEKISIPDSVTTIGSEAFMGCTALTTVEVNKTTSKLEIIGTSAFENCEKLNNIVLPDSLELIRGGAFRGCISLTKITIPAKTTFNDTHSMTPQLVDEAFAGCKALEEVVFEASETVTKSTGHYTFQNCTALKKVVFSAAVVEIGNSAFSGCTALTSVELPAALRTINASAFEGCSALTGEIAIPNTTIAVSADAFKGTAITSVTFAEPSGDVDKRPSLSIAAGAFRNCASLTSVDFGGAMPLTSAAKVDTFQGHGADFTIRYNERFNAVFPENYKSCSDCQGHRVVPYGEPETTVNIVRAEGKTKNITVKFDAGNEEIIAQYPKTFEIKVSNLALTNHETTVEIDWEDIASARTYNEDGETIVLKGIPVLGTYTPEGSTHTYTITDANKLLENKTYKVTVNIGRKERIYDYYEFAEAPLRLKNGTKITEELLPEKVTLYMHPNGTTEKGTKTQDVQVTWNKARFAYDNIRDADNPLKMIGSVTLPKGVYLSAADISGAKENETIDVEYTVIIEKFVAPELESVVWPADLVYTQEEVDSAEMLAGLLAEEKAKLHFLDGGDSFTENADIKWDTSVLSGFSEEAYGVQSFEVEAEVTLPEDTANAAGIPLKTKLTVQVAANPIVDRELPKAPDDPFVNGTSIEDIFRAIGTETDLKLRDDDKTLSGSLAGKWNLSAASAYDPNSAAEQTVRIRAELEIPEGAVLVTGLSDVTEFTVKVAAKMPPNLVSAEPTRTVLNFENGTSLDRIMAEVRNVKAALRFDYGGNVTQTVSWKEPVGYDPEKDEAQNLTLTGTFDIPDGKENRDKLSDEVALTVIVKGKPVYTGYDPLEPISVPNGTSYNEIIARLPAKVSLNFNDGTSRSVDVEWNTDDIPTRYNPAVTAEQTFTVSGSFDIPEDAANPDNLPDTADVLVTAAAKVWPDVPENIPILKLDEELPNDFDLQKLKDLLPKTTTIELSDGSEAECEIQWDMDSLKDENKNSKEDRKITMKGKAKVSKEDVGEDKEVEVEIEIEVDGWDILVEVIDPEKKTVGYGTDLNIVLPRAVTIRVKDNENEAYDVRQAEVPSWDLTPFDPNETDEKTYTFTSASVILPDGVYNPDGADDKAEIKVTVTSRAPLALKSAASLTCNPVNNGTLPEDFGLPTEVLLTFEDDSTQYAGVVWETAGIGADDYAHDLKDAKTITVNGTFALPAGTYVQAPLTNEVSVEVTVLPKAKLTGIAAPADVNADNSVPAAEIPLPETVTMTFDGRDDYEAAVRWNTAPLTDEFLGHNESMVQSAVLTGTCELPAGVIDPDGLCGTVTVTVNIAPKAKIVSIEPFDPVTGIPNGAQPSDISAALPDTAKIVRDDASVVDAEVRWSSDFSGVYNPSVGTKQAFDVPGTVVLPANTINPGNAVPLDVVVRVEVDAKPNLVEILNPDDITGIPNGTALEDIPLPAAVTLVLDNAQTLQAPVHWDLSDVSYDPESAAEQTFTLTGTVDIPSSVLNLTPIPNEAEVRVTVSEKVRLAEIVPPDMVEIPGGEGLDEDKLPDTVDLICEDGSVVKAEVDWDLENTNYDPNSKDEQRVTVKGTVQLPDTVGNPDGISLDVEVIVVIEASAENWESFLGLLNWKGIILSSAGEGGSVSPSGRRPVHAGETITYTFTPDEGYEILEVLVDGRSVGAVSEYTFRAITANHTISVEFMEIPEETPFKDVNEGDWFYEDVRFVSENGLMKGVSEDRFSPDGALTRAMLVTVLWRLEGEPFVNYIMPFTDIPANEWYTEAVRWAAAEGIVNGYEDGTFGHGREITREQVMAILHRYAAYKGLDNGVIFPMIPQCDYSPWAENDIIWADMIGLTDGIGKDIFDMTKSADRGEIAAYLRRFCEAFEE